MAILKCKMCGGDILLSEDKTTGTCDHCGSTMTFPRVSDEQKLNLYNRANHFRRQNEFDKAITAYERILDQDDTDAEAHWGAVLSRYGIEYVEDPVTHERIPTCHRVQISSILSDGDYLAALENAPDTASRALYEQEAHRIAEIQKGILSISSQEKPYDVFICYKETDDFGSRTKDSTLAQEIYYQLTNEGYKVFFSRITLEDKLGQQYEPYIFAALNSAKVMLVIGTKPEYFNAVWVKNEWSRYLALMKNDRSRLLIPCYRDMDPYDLPEELSALQSQDMSKIGFVQDLIRGVKKVLDSKKPAEPKPVAPQVTAAGANIENLMKRAYLFMEDGDFASANEYLDKVLDENAEYAPAYAGKVCTSLGFSKEAQLGEATFLYAENPDWKKVLRFASPRQKAVYEGYYEQVKARVAQQIRDYAFDCAMEMAVNPKANRAELDQDLADYQASCQTMSKGRPDGSRRLGAAENEAAFSLAVKEKEPGEISEQNYRQAAEMFQAVQNAASYADQCLFLAGQASLKEKYESLVLKAGQYRNAVELDQYAEQFMSISHYKDSVQRAQLCREQAEHMRKSFYDDIQNDMKKAGDDLQRWKLIQSRIEHADLDGYLDIELQRKKAKHRYQECYEAEKEANQQAQMAAKRKEKEAAAKKKKITIFSILTVVIAIAAILLLIMVIIPKGHYDKGIALRSSQQWEEAIAEFEQAGDYSDAKTQIVITHYAEGKAKYSLQDWNGVIEALKFISDYKDADYLMNESYYFKAYELYQEGNYQDAYKTYCIISEYKDVSQLLTSDNNLKMAAYELWKAQFIEGKTIKFGEYEQDDVVENGKEPITWIVLSVNKNKALLISEKALDFRAFDGAIVRGFKADGSTYTYGYGSNHWPDSDIREWLNGTFINDAFSFEDQKRIILSDVDNNADQCENKNDCWYQSEVTKDRLFLLSYNEVFNIYNRKFDKICYATDYVVNHFRGIISSGKVEWWLRSPVGRATHDFAATVSNRGSSSYSDVSGAYSCIRPAFWIDMTYME